MDRLKNQTFQAKVLLVLIFILLNLALVHFVALPGIGSVDEIATGHNDKLLRVELMLANERTINEKEANIELLKVEVDGFEDMVPDYVDYPQVIYDFYTYTLKYEVSPLYLSFSDAAIIEVPLADGEQAEESKPVTNAEDKEIISTLTLNYSAMGSAENIVRFLRELEEISPLALTVDNVSLYDTEDGQLGVDVTFIQYVRGLKASDTPYEEYSFYVDSVGFEDIAALFGSSASVPAPGVPEEPVEAEPVDDDLQEDTAP